MSVGSVFLPQAWILSQQRPPLQQLKIEDISNVLISVKKVLNTFAEINIGQEAERSIDTDIIVSSILERVRTKEHTSHP